MDSTLTVDVELDVRDIREALELDDTFSLELHVEGETDDDRDSDTASLTFYTPGRREGSFTHEVEVSWLEILGALEDCDPEEMARAITASGSAGEALKLLLKTEGVDFLRQGLDHMTGMDRAVFADDLRELLSTLEP